MCERQHGNGGNISILLHASPSLIHGKSRMRRRARTDLCGGRSVMAVPTATAILPVPVRKSAGQKLMSEATEVPLSHIIVARARVPAMGPRHGLGPLFLLRERLQARLCRSPGSPRGNERIVHDRPGAAN